MSFKRLNDEINVVIAVWILLTIFLQVCISYFWINGFISHPQHEIYGYFDQVSLIIRQEHKVAWYDLYLLLDCLWSASLLLIIGIVCKENDGKPLLHIEAKSLASFIFKIAAIIALLLDFIENIKYFSYNSSGLKDISDYKLYAYLICLSFLLYQVLKKYIFLNLKHILRFIVTSLFSIIFILLVYALVTIMPQGRTLVVDLFYHPVNIVIFFFLLTFLSIIISHYPVYVDIWLNGNNSCVKLRMAKKLRVLGMGIIYYDTLQNSPNYASYNNKLVKKLRRSMGILLYVAVFNIFLGVGSYIFEVEYNSAFISIIIFVITLFIYGLNGRMYEKWKENLFNEAKPDLQKKTVADIVTYVHRFPWFLIGCIGFSCVTAGIAWYFQWSRVTLWVFFFTLGCQMFLYIQFKIARTYLKYVYYSEKLYKSNNAMFDKNTSDVFKKYYPYPEKGKHLFYRVFGMLSNNIIYLRVMQFSGVISFLVLIAANASPAVATWFNPINIVLLYIIFFYSIGTIIFKHILFYHRLWSGAYHCHNFYRYGIPLIFCVVIAVAFYSGKQGNDLHQLTVVPRMEKPLGYKEYLQSMISGQSGEKNNYFFLGSYGGGLKANLWNLLLLNKLEQQSHHAFFNRTIAMSGVSGGAVGIGNFSSLLYERKPSEMDGRIYDIGISNVLSNELTDLLGCDWIREYWPTYSGHDRAYKSMQVHAINTGMGLKKFDSVAFSDYWLQIYKKRHRKFPALIMNSTAVGGRQGVASTVEFPETSFPGAIRMDTFGIPYRDSTLTYYAAISTTNRFPLFSPTAKIPTKGSFLDGGYFENSGMLSLLGIYDAIGPESGYDYHQRIQPVFINVINSEDYYIAEKLRQWHVVSKDLKESGEFTSIVSTVTSIDKLPGYVNKKIQARGYVVEEIMMPHKITYEKVRDILKSDVLDPLSLMKHIKAHNDTINWALDDYAKYDRATWGLVTPPLARLLSKPAVRYQEAMIACHPDVQQALDRILKYIATPEIVNKKFQHRLKSRYFNRE